VPTTGYVRLLEVASIAFQVLAYVETSYAGLRMRQSFFGLNGSEKQGPAFRIGMACAKVFAEHRLRVPVLEHADALVESGALALAVGGKRGDLVGCDIDGDWHVMEAKARSSGAADVGTVRHAKEQARNIRLVDQATQQQTNPATASAAVTTLADAPIAIHVRDPDGEEPTLYYMRPDEVRSSHYDLIRTLLEVQGELRREQLPADPTVTVRLGDLPRTGIELGVHESVYEALRDPTTRWSDFLSEFGTSWEPQWSAVEPTPSGETFLDEAGTWSVGLDGYFVRVTGRQE
jgi:hypothetical protein